MAKEEKAHEKRKSTGGCRRGNEEMTVSWFENSQNSRRETAHKELKENTSFKKEKREQQRGESRKRGTNRVTGRVRRDRERDKQSDERR